MPRLPIGCSSIGHFRIIVSLFFKASPGAHPFIWKLVFIHMQMKWYEIVPPTGASATQLSTLVTKGLFLKSPKTFRAYFGWHNSLCIFKKKASRSTKLCSYFCFYSLYNIWKDQLYRISRSYFYEWLFGPAKFSGLLRNTAQEVKICHQIGYWKKD